MEMILCVANVTARLTATAFISLAYYNSVVNIKQTGNNDINVNGKSDTQTEWHNIYVSLNTRMQITFLIKFIISAF